MGERVRIRSFPQVTALGLPIELAVHAGGGNATLSIGRLKIYGDSLCRGTFALPAGLKTIALRVLVDGVSLEVFAAGGRGVCSYAQAKPPTHVRKTPSWPRSWANFSLL